MATYGAYNDLTPARAGTPDALGGFVESKIANAAIQFGDPVVYAPADPNKAYLPDQGTATLRFAGVALHSPRSFVDSEGEYPAGDTVSVMTEGRVWVRLASGVATATTIANKPAYIDDDPVSVDYKKFTDVSTNNQATGGFFVTNAINGLAVVELKGRQ